MSINGIGKKIISKNERTKETLVQHVRTIFKVIKHMEHEVWYKYPQAVNHLPDEIFFYHNSGTIRYVSKYERKGKRKMPSQKNMVAYL